MRICTQCGSEKPEADFYSAGSGLQSRCKGCMGENYRRHYKENVEFREKRRVKQREWNSKNKFYRALRRSSSAAKRGGYAECVASLSDITIAFNGECVICGAKECELTKGLCMDHDHKTGAFRGWLCTSCNVAIGLMRDSFDVAYRASQYLNGTLNRS